MKFVCPNCNSQRIEEVMVNVTVASIMSDVTSEGDCTYHEQTNDGGEVDHYQCVDCGEVVGDVDNLEQLYVWISEHQPSFETTNDCAASELHLTDCDEDGYCNYCGHQEGGE